MKCLIYFVACFVIVIPSIYAISKFPVSSATQEFGASVVTDSPTLVFGQKVILNNDFFQNTKAVVVARLGEGTGKYTVSLLEGPVVRGGVRINSRITLPLK